MSYYFSKTVKSDFDHTITAVTEALKQEGFGLLTDIDVKQTFKRKLNIDFKNYRILGACNPQFAYRALQTEDKIGTMLPCNVIVQEEVGGMVTVAAIDPTVSMQGVKNPDLAEIAHEVRVHLKRVIDQLN